MDSDIDNIPLASTYRLTATSFRLSAEILHKSFKSHKENLPKNIRSMPFYYLISHACELLLKSALLKRGVSEQKLMHHRLRHNLQELLAELESHNVIITKSTKELISMLSTQHKKHYLRYTALLDDGNTVFTPPPDNLFKMLDELLLCTRL
jgi:hypothetical protein